MDSSKVSYTQNCLLCKCWSLSQCKYLNHGQHGCQILYHKVICVSIKGFIFSVTEFKTVSYTVSQKEASQQAALFRTWKQSPEYSLLFPIANELFWGNDKQAAKGEKPISQHTVSEHIVVKLPSRNSEFFDEDYMKSFLKRSQLDAITYDAARYTRRQLMPNSCSLLDFVAADSQRKDTWCVSKYCAPAEELFHSFQKTKGLSLKLLDQVVVKEIRVGVDTQERVEQTVDWAVRQWENDQKQCPTGVISMDVEALQLANPDLDALFKAIDDMSQESLLVKNLRGKKLEKKTTGQLPVKIMIGNGMSWALMISIIIEPVSAGRFRVTLPRFQPALLKYLKDLPRVVGVGIKADVFCLESMIQAIADPEFKFRGFIEVSSMAVLAGWNFKFFNMQALSVQALGAFMNKSVSCGDHKWGCRWKEIPKPLQVYCLGDVKFGHQTSVLFLSMLLRDIFPDPDIVLSFTRMDGHNFMRWFSLWIGDVLQDVEVDPRRMGQVETRAELLYALRFRRSNKKLSETPPSRVSLVAQLLGSWPSVRYGGPRYLHQVRRHFITQCSILKDAGVRQWQDIMPYPTTVRMESSACYAIPHLSALDYTLPAEKASTGLGVHPGLFHLV